MADNDQPDFANNADNSANLLGGYHFYVDVDGITFEGSRTSAIALNEGGGEIDNCTFRFNYGYPVWQGNKSSDLHIRNSTFEKNKGRVHCSTSHMFLHQCTFEDNSGGAVIADIQGVVIAEDCRFAGNTATSGGAIRLYGDGDFAFAQCTRCEFVDNTAQSGGAISFGFTGGAKFTDCTFTNNRAYRGGAMCMNDEYTYFDANGCTFTDNVAEYRGGVVAAAGVDEYDAGLRFKNCVFFHNSAGQEGGAIFARNSSVRTNNCTFARNAAAATTAIYTALHAKVTVSNSILSSNPGGSFAGLGMHVVRYSDVAGGAPGDGNLNVNPKFVNLLSGDLRLQPGSRCIDAGNNAYLLADVTTDADGNPRFVDDPATLDTGAGDRPVIDMGAYEYQPN